MLCWLFDTAEALLGAGTQPLPDMYYFEVAASWSFPWLGCARLGWGRGGICMPAPALLPSGVSAATSWRGGHCAAISHGAQTNCCLMN